MYLLSDSRHRIVVQHSHNQCSGKEENLTTLKACRPSTREERRQQRKPNDRDNETVENHDVFQCKVFRRSGILETLLNAWVKVAGLDLYYLKWFQRVRLRGCPHWGRCPRRLVLLRSARSLSGLYFRGLYYSGVSVHGPAKSIRAARPPIGKGLGGTVTTVRRMDDLCTLFLSPKERDTANLKR